MKKIIRLFIKLVRLFLLVIITASVLGFTVSCRTTKIGDILDNFSSYEGKEVTITGTVGETVWFSSLERGGFQAGDGSGNIWIISNQPPPADGQKVTVTGAAQSVFELGGRSFGKVIMETRRK